MHFQTKEGDTINFSDSFSLDDYKLLGKKLFVGEPNMYTNCFYPCCAMTLSLLDSAQIRSLTWALTATGPKIQNCDKRIERKGAEVYMSFCTNSNHGDVYWYLSAQHTRVSATNFDTVRLSKVLGRHQVWWIWT